MSFSPHPPSPTNSSVLWDTQSIGTILEDWRRRGQDSLYGGSEGGGDGQARESYKGEAGDLLSERIGSLSMEDQEEGFQVRGFC